MPAPGRCPCILRGRRGASGAHTGLMYAFVWCSVGCGPLSLHFASRVASGPPTGLMYALVWSSVCCGPLRLHFAWEARLFRRSRPPGPASKPCLELLSNLLPVWLHLETFSFYHYSALKLSKLAFRPSLQLPPNSGKAAKFKIHLELIPVSLALSLCQYILI